MLIISEPEVRSQEPGTGSHESGTRSQEPGNGSRESPKKRCRVSDLGRVPKEAPGRRALLIYEAHVVRRMTQEEVGRQFGISQSRVGQIVQRVRLWKSNQPWQLPGLTEQQQINLATHETRQWLEALFDKALQEIKSPDPKVGFMNAALRAVSKLGELGGAGQQWKRRDQEPGAGNQEPGAGNQEPGNGGQETEAPRKGLLLNENEDDSCGDDERRCSDSCSSKCGSAQVEQSRPSRKMKKAGIQALMAEKAAAEKEAAEREEAERKRAAWSQGDPCPEQVPLVTWPEVNRAVEICRGRGAVIVNLDRSWNCGRLHAFGTCDQEGPTILEEMAFVPADTSQPPKLREPLRTAACSLTADERWDILDRLGDVGVAVLDLDGQWHEAESLAHCDLRRDGTVIFREIAHCPIFTSGWGDTHRRRRQQEELARLIDPSGDEAFARQRNADIWTGGVLSFERG